MAKTHSRNWSMSFAILVAHSIALAIADDSVGLFENPLPTGVDGIHCASQGAEADEGICRPANVAATDEPPLEKRIDDVDIGVENGETDRSKERRKILDTLEKLEEEEKQLAEELEKLENKTKTADALANELLEPYRKPIEYPVSELDFLKDEVLATEVFNELDLDSDGILEVSEVRKHRELFDLNKNGHVEDNEIIWFHNFYPSRVNVDFFVQNMWKRIGRWYMYQKEVKKSGEFWTEKRLSAEIKYMNVNYDDEDFEDQRYTKAVRKAVLDSISSRIELNHKKSDLKSMQFNIRVLKRQLNGQENPDEGSEDDVMEYVHNFGPKEKATYFPGRLVCYKYHNFTHIFRVCPFHAALSNVIVDGDRDRFVNTVILGEWAGWIYWKGEPTMFFRKGAACGENGTFKTKVKFRCTKKEIVRHRLVSVEEVSPCEYMMTLIGPIGCDLGLPMANEEQEKSTPEREAEMEAKLSEEEKSRAGIRDEL